MNREYHTSIAGHAIDNGKLEAGPDGRPRWAAHAGFTLLFDNPDLLSGGLRHDGVGEVLNCQPAAAGQALYAALEAWVQRQSPKGMLTGLGFCAMPASTYHVTAWDGLNVAVLGQLHARQHAAAANALAQSHNDPRHVLNLAEPTRATCDALNALLPLAFRFAGLRSSTGVGLVADLRPADAGQAKAFEQFQAARALHAKRHAQHWGFAYTTPLRPHVTLGYYINRQAGEAVEARLPQWEAELFDQLDGLRLRFDSIGLYAFLDMVRFYRLPELRE